MSIESESEIPQEQEVDPFFGKTDRLFVFDGYCGVCTRVALYAEKRTKGKVRILPNQTPGLLEEFDLTKEDVDDAVWLIEKEGEMFKGEKAMNEVMKVMEKGWGKLSKVAQLPLFRNTEGLVYRSFAKHRGKFHRFGVTPACENPNFNCTPLANAKK